MRTSKLMIILLLVVTSSMYTGAQTVLTQDFEGGTFPPTGWSNLQGGSGNLWTTSANYHGGAKAAEYNYDYTYNANAWLISSGVSLVAGNTYTITYWEEVFDSDYPENLKLTVGTSQTIVGQTTTLQTLVGLTNTTYNQQTTTFTPSTSGTYYFGWNCYSDANMWDLYIDDIEIAHITCTTPGTPAALSGSGTGTTTANLSWSAGTPAGSATVTYYWSLYTSGSTLVTSGNTTSASASVTGLTCNSSYYFTVYARTNCDNTNSSTATSGNFSTSACAVIPSCVTNDPATDSCSVATTISNFNGYCGNTSDDYTVDDPGNLGDLFCGSIDNNSWLKFVADSTTATLNIFVSNCANNWGIQMEIFGTTDCSNFISYSNCWNPGIMTDGTISATGLTIGETYYLMIDGWAGDVCDFVISASSGVNTMPISLASFKAKCEDDVKKITWTTASESNNNYFTIEKSDNGIDWEFLQQVKGAGNSNEFINYSITDRTFDRSAYYRLKQTDYDGKFEIFSPIFTDCDNNYSNIKVYPNPTTDVLNIEASNINIIEIKITDMTGSIIFQSIDNLRTIDTSNFKLGIYTLKITDDRNETNIFKIVKK